MEKTYNYSNCTVKVIIPKDNSELVKKATENFLKEVIKRGDLIGKTLRTSKASSK